VPVIILNLSPGAAIDYAAFNAMADRGKMTGEWLAWCQACPVPEIANVFRRCNIPFFQVTGMLENDPAAWGEIDEWLDAAQVAHAMEHNRLGVMGHYYGGMLDVYSDLTLQCATFGGHIEILEVDELAALREAVSRAEIDARICDFMQVFDVQADCSRDELERAARTSVALDRLAGRHALGSLAYYYSGSANSANEDAIGSIILGTSLLTARGIPVAGECEVKNAQAMKIMDAFGAGGSFTEYYATDYADDVVLMGHDGPGHMAIAEGKIKVRPLQVYHGKVGRGLSVEMSVKHGPVTLLSVVETGGQVKLLVAEAESVPGPILEIGNTNNRTHRRQDCETRVAAGNPSRAGVLTFLSRNSRKWQGPLAGARGSVTRSVESGATTPQFQPGGKNGLSMAHCKFHDIRSSDFGQHRRELLLRDFLGWAANVGAMLLCGTSDTVRDIPSSGVASPLIINNFLIGR
jgi:L-arabinose isomerase